MTKRQKRSSGDGMPARGSTRSDRVGGRHQDPPPARRGGGYLDVCNEPGSLLGPEDPRLEELREVGLNRTWLRVARRIGFDAFFETWRTLCEESQVQDERGRVYVPNISQYFRYQRNRLILSLSRAGRPPDEIQTIVEERLREKVSRKHIQRILNQANN